MSSHAWVDSPRTRRVAAAVAGGVAALVVGIGGLFAWLTYSMVAGGECGFLDKQVNPDFRGWGDTGGGVAMALGMVLWIVVGVFVLRRPGRVGRGLFWFAAIYGVCLFVVGLIAPHIWDAPACRPIDIIF